MSHANALGHRDVLSAENTTLSPGAGRMGAALMGVGAVLALAGIGVAKAGMGGATLRQGLAAVHVGVMGVLGICLSAMLFVMIFHLLNAGWTSTLRRQFENIMALTPMAFGMVLVVLAADIVLQGQLFAFLDPKQHADTLLQKKWAYFFLPMALPEDPAKVTTEFVPPVFWMIRAAFYGVFWWFLGGRLWKYSVEQDSSGDPWLSAQARRTSAWGVPVLALTIAFASFDWLMALDFRFFSTMFGVYFFAGATFAMFATVALIATSLNRQGKLIGAVTSEHYHDLGKLLFIFACFWGYIAFSQYFLIWYSNIPEETAYFVHRTHPNSVWRPLGVALILGHFVLPFLFLMSRHVKKNRGLFTLGAILALVAHFLDMVFIVRPMTYVHEYGHPESTYGSPIVDALGILGVIVLFAGLLIRKMGSGPLLAAREPYLHEGLEHRNYV